MTTDPEPHNQTHNQTGHNRLGRRDFLKRATGTAITAATAAMAGTGLLLPSPSRAAAITSNPGNTQMSQNAFVYTELQISAPFDQVPWQNINQTIKTQPGFLNKTWLSGLGNNSAGGIYAFDTIENAKKFVTGYFPAEARNFGVAQTTRVFDALATSEASIDMNSVHYGARVDVKPAAFVYTEVQLHVLPFDNGPWRTFNPVLKQQPGLLSKTWLSGLHTGTVGGFYAFDSIENAKRFALDYFPTETRALDAAFYTRIFDATVTEAASRDMASPFYR
ncbi:YdhR family protein [Thalassospira sp. MCCC 1A03138]|uniref:YdhR family protein n=1 Tax=Thalassospira sp. MCCC 1A03138 TaxID=1470576 RepID=UPI000A1DBDE5|nr:YdhR family protein [Thalassospira sp. MCCC 1A03138]